MNTQPRPSILIVDDESSIRDAFYLILQDYYSLDNAASGEAAVKKIVDKKVDLVFLDIRMPGIDGIETLKKIKSIDDTIEVVMVTAVNDVQKAGEAIKIGANDYILKPFDVEEILYLTKKLAGKKQLKQETRSIRDRAKSNIDHPEMSGYSDYIQSLTEKIEQLSIEDGTIMFVGETGTEKDSIALQIHTKSTRRQSPFNQVNLFNWSGFEMIEHLFGEGKGSNLNFLDKESGVIEETLGGTLLINNIDIATKQLQDMLLDVIRNKRMKRLGSTQDIPVDIRFMASSTKDLNMLVEDNKFSKELFELLSGTIINILPLRKRKEDIPSIINSYAESSNSKGTIKFSQDAVNVLAQYKWPGNTKELKNLIRRIILTKDPLVVNAADLPFDILITIEDLFSFNEIRDLSYEKLSGIFEKEFVSTVIKRTNNDFNKASTIMQVSRHYLEN